MHSIHHHHRHNTSLDVTPRICNGDKTIVPNHFAQSNSRWQVINLKQIDNTFPPSMLQGSVASSSRFPGRGMRGWCTGSRVLQTAQLMGTKLLCAGRSTSGPGGARQERQGREGPLLPRRRRISRARAAPTGSRGTGRTSSNQGDITCLHGKRCLTTAPG